MIALCSQFLTKHINAPCQQSVEYFNFETGGTDSNH